MSVGGGSVGHVLDLIRRAGGLTRAEIIEKSGLSRTTVAARLEALQAAGLISSGQSTAARGRPPSHFHFRADQGALLIADAGATGVRTAITDLGGHIRDERHGRPRHHGRTPRMAGSVGELLDELLEKHRRDNRFGAGYRLGGARPRGLRQRDGGQPAHHDRMGRLPHPVLVRTALRLPGRGRQRRERDGAGRAHQRVFRSRLAGDGQGRHRYRCRDHRPRLDLPRRRRRRRGHRPHPDQPARRRFHPRWQHARVPVRELRLLGGVCGAAGPYCATSPAADAT